MPRLSPRTSSDSPRIPTTQIQQHDVSSMSSESMYHVFAAEPPATRQMTENGTTEQRRISTSSACLECRRKKTRCGGGLPCRQCVWAEKPEMCKYAQRARRTVPSQRCVLAVAKRQRYQHRLTRDVQYGAAVTAYHRPAVNHLLPALSRA